MATREDKRLPVVKTGKEPNEMNEPENASEPISVAELVEMADICNLLGKIWPDLPVVPNENSPSLEREKEGGRGMVVREELV
jgi:hypothetical protein